MFTKEDKQEINELVSKLQYNDMQALEKLYTKMYRAIFCFLKKFCFNDEIIKEAIENTFITILKKAKEKMYYKNCYAWILKIAKFTLFNLNRKFKKEIDYDEHDYEMQDPSIEREFNSIEIGAVMDKLSVFNQRILYLKVFMGLSYREVAEVMGVSESTVIRRYKKLREYLKEELEYER